MAKPKNKTTDKKTKEPAYFTPLPNSCNGDVICSWWWKKEERPYSVKEWTEFLKQAMYLSDEQSQIVYNVLQTIDNQARKVF